MSQVDLFLSLLCFVRSQNSCLHSVMGKGAITILSNIASHSFLLFSSSGALIDIYWRLLTYSVLLNCFPTYFNFSLWVEFLMNSTVVICNSQILFSFMSSIKSIPPIEVLLRNSKLYIS